MSESPAASPLASPGASAVPLGTFMYRAARPLATLAWSARPDRPLRLAAGSFGPDAANTLEVVQVNQGSVLERRSIVPHPYPATKVMFIPDPDASWPDLMASTGDHLRFWEISADGHQVVQKACLSNKKTGKCSPPLTSFDWNVDDPRLLGTSSVDTTCSIWDVMAEKAVMQLIAHDKEVFDISFSKGTNIFGSVGGDGSVRLFDLRSLERSTIIYESSDYQPALRLCWNRLDTNYVAAVLAESSSVLLLDVRVPAVAMALLNGHSRVVNSVQWAPHNATLLCSSGDDGRALIWDVAALTSDPPQRRLFQDPQLSYTAEAEVPIMRWSSLQPDWVALCAGQTLQLLHL